MAKRCLNCGYERQPEDESEFTPASECPKCRAIYDKVEKWISEKERERQLSVSLAGTAAPVAEEKPPVIHQPGTPVGAITGDRDRLDTPSKPFSINQNQKRILIAVIAVIVAMLLYPPFQMVRNGTIYNMGYGWISDLSTRGYKTINVSLLLVQWIGVLVVGGIAFFLTKGASSPPVSSPQQTTVVTSPIEKPKKEDEGLYEAILGEKNSIYYLAKFKEFDQQVPGLNAGWNWAAFFFSGTWALYRKMYGWLFALSGIMIISGFFEKEGFSVLGFFLLLGPWIAFTVFANSLYYRSVKKKIAVAQRSIRDKSKLLELLRHKGGVHTWVIWVCCLLPILGILAAIAIPQFTAYKQRGYEAAELARRNAELNSPATPPQTTAPAPEPAPAPTPETGRDGRFIAYDNGTVLDTSTNLMWAAKDNGNDINWTNAKSYCENYRGGDYTDWRMPTQDELAGLYEKSQTYKNEDDWDVHLTKLIRLTRAWAWTSETHGSVATSFDFNNGNRNWVLQSKDGINRALPVRSGSK